MFHLRDIKEMEKNAWDVLLWILQNNYLVLTFTKTSEFTKKSDHSHKEQNDSLGKQAELPALCAYFENQATIEPILIYRVSK